MGLHLWLAQRSYIPGEPAVDRTRKDLVVPVYCLLGALCWVGGIPLVTSPGAYDTDTTVQSASVYLRRIAVGLTGAALLPAGVYVMWTRKISRTLCEIPATVFALAIIIFDIGRVLDGAWSVVSLNVIVLDCLLVCSCSGRYTTAVLLLTIAWACVRAVLERENISGNTCLVFERFSIRYFGECLVSLSVVSILLVVDFRFTRGFANAMNKQKALVVASIEFTELAAIALSNYETEVTEKLLYGPGGEQLPPGLRSALLRLVADLALYRAYLPQSCLPGHLGGGVGSDDSDSGDSTGSGSGPANDARGWSASSADSSSSSRPPHVVDMPRPSPREESSPRPAGVVAAAQRRRTLSLLAVNSKDFLRDVGGGVPDPACSFIRAEVEQFAAEVVAERGVVDVVSGDHMYANFNGSRICGAHRVGASRVAWALRVCADTGRQRTAAVCSGTALSGDFGPASMRRFMVLGPVANTVHALERVAAQLRMVLVDELVACDTEVRSCFASVLVERVCYAKRDRKPFMVWHLCGSRQTDGPVEWMYDLQRLRMDPRDAWNKRMREWLFGGRPLDPELLCEAPFPAGDLTGLREQSFLVDASVVGPTVAFAPSLPPFTPLAADPPKWDW